MREKEREKERNREREKKREEKREKKKREREKGEKKRELERKGDYYQIPHFNGARVTLSHFYRMSTTTSITGVAIDAFSTHTIITI